MRILRSRFWTDGVRWIFLLAVMSATLAAQSAAAASRIVTEADNGSTVHLKVGDKLIVHLRANPSTGYMWYVEPKSTPLLKLVRQMEIDNAGPDATREQAAGPGSGTPALPRLGRPVVQVFEFVALRAGQGVLRLHYVRSWEKPKPDEERFELGVSVE